MNIVNLIALLRVKLADLADADNPSEVYLFKDVDIIDALNKAQDIFAVETLCLFDSQVVPVVANTKFIDVPVGTVAIKSALTDSSLLTLVTQHELDYGYFSLNNREDEGRFSKWRNKAGIPKFLITDLGPLTTRLVPYPLSAVTITFERYRLPTELALDPVKELEIPVQFHRSLIFGAVGYLLENADADTYRPEKAASMFMQWERVLNDAKIQLQTGLRLQERRLDLPSGVEFKEGRSNIVGAEPISNT